MDRKNAKIKFAAVFLLLNLLFYSGSAFWLLGKIGLDGLAEKFAAKEAASVGGDVILLWDTANNPIPGGWTCISCNPGEPFYGVFPRASSSYSSVTYGSDTHNHTASYSNATQGANDDTTKGSSGSVVAINTHTHTWGSPTVNSGDVRPPFKNLNFIYASAPATLPANVIAVFDTGSLPSGWARYAALDGNYLRGYSDNITGGSASHTHTTGAVTSGASGATVADSGSGASAASGHTHTLAASSFTTSDNNAPPYLEVVFAYNSSGSDTTIPDGLIAFFDAAPPTNWDTVSDASPWSGSFFKGAAGYGGTGGSAADHNHGGSNDLTSGTPSATNSNRGSTGTNIGAHNTHTHTVTYTIDSQSSLPAYRDVIVAKYTPPAGPDATGYTSSEAALSFANCGSTGCGGRIGQTITVTGTGFGASVSNKDTCTAGTSNGCVRVGSYTVPASNVSSWADTQIVFTVPAGISVFGGSGTTCGGAGAGVCVTQNGTSDPALEFWTFPNITSVSPSGAGEGKEGDSITISGTRFDASTATGTVVFQNCGTGDVSATVSSWTDTSVAITVPAGITDDDNACDIKLTRAAGTGSKTASSANFVVLPEIDGINVDPSISYLDSARTYDAGDGQGLIMLYGTHLGSSGSVTILGSAATQHAGADTPCTFGGYRATTTCLEVPNDSDYTGNVVLTRGGDSKSHTYAGFRILPRLTGVTPSSASPGDDFTLSGNHFCQNNGSCPSAYDASNKITFSGGNATTTDFFAWTGTTASSSVPSAAASGNITLTSNTYDSNALSFTVLSPVPDDPTALNQYRNAGLTDAISVGGAASATPLYFKMTMQVGLSGGTLYPQVEYKPIGTAFSCSGGGSCGAATEGAGVAGPGPSDGSVSASPADEVYHWQARVRHNKNSTNYYSSWVSFGGNGEGATDFQMDTTAPTITFPGAGDCAAAISGLETNGVTISWNLNQNADGQIRYSKNSDLSSGWLYPATPAANALSHTIDLNNLDSNTTYYFQTRSSDPNGNLATKPSGSPYCSFATGNVTQPAKTVKFFISGLTGAVSGGGLATSSFSVYIPEASYSIKDAFVELSGISAGNGTNNLAVQVIGAGEQATSTYAIASNETFFRVFYPISAANLNLDPSANIIYVSPSLATDIMAAKLYVNYAFTP